MHYLINKNPGCIEIECRNEDLELLKLWQEDQYLTKTMVIVSDADDLAFEFDKEFLIELAEEHLISITWDEDDIELIAEQFWEQLPNINEDIIIYPNPDWKPKSKSGAGSKRKIKTTGKQKPKAKQPPKKVVKGRTRITAKSLAGKTLKDTTNNARDGSIMAQIQNFAQGGELFETIRDEFMLANDRDEKYTNGYITGAIREGYLQIIEDDEEDW